MAAQPSANHPWHSDFVSWVQATPRISAGLVMATGVAVLFGWLIDNTTLKSVFPSTASMKANTAVAFILLGMSLWMLTPAATSRTRRAIGLAGAVAAGLIGLATLTEYLSGADLGIDQILAHDVAGAPGVTATGRMASSTATCFVLLGAALLLLPTRLFRWAQLPAALAALIALLALAGYIYDARDLAGFGRQTQMAVHTSLSFLALTAGVVAVRPEGMMKVIVSRDSGGAAARRLVPAAVAVPFLLGWLRLLGERAGLYAPELGLALFATSNVVVFLGLIWLTGRSLNATDAQRLAAEQEVRTLNEELEARVEARTAELAAANEELEAFSYSISHDLRAPLRAIDGFSRILQEEHAETLDPAATRFLGVIRQNVHQMGDLVDDLLAFSRLSRQPVKRMRVNPATIVREAIEQLDVPPERRSQIILGQLSECSADPALLKQVYVNLLSNALKFTEGRPGPRIEIGCTQLAGEDVCYVRDNGVGFDMRYAGKLFGVFQRLHPASQYEGTGVGLAIVQRIVHRHGGRVWAESEVDHGATFFFTIGKGDSAP